jgi:dCTP deaminase
LKLADLDIIDALASGRIVIEPQIDDSQIGPVSVDLTLGDTFMTFRHARVPYIDLAPAARSTANVADIMDRFAVPDGESFYLHPGEFALGTTQEKVVLPADIAGWLDGRSSLARVGLMVHATAHTIEPGWSGQITLEFYNAGKLALGLRPGMRVCAISFEPLTRAATRTYAVKAGAKYRDQAGPLASRIRED